MTDKEKEIYDAGYNVGYYRGWLSATKFSLVVITIMCILVMLN